MMVEMGPERILHGWQDVRIQSLTVTVDCMLLPWILFHSMVFVHEYICTNCRFACLCWDCPNVSRIFRSRWSGRPNIYREVFFVTPWFLYLHGLDKCRMRLSLIKIVYGMLDFDFPRVFDVHVCEFHWVSVFCLFRFGCEYIISFRARIGGAWCRLRFGCFS